MFSNRKRILSAISDTFLVNATSMQNLMNRNIHHYCITTDPRFNNSDGTCILLCITSVEQDETETGRQQARREAERSKFSLHYMWVFEFMEGGRIKIGSSWQAPTAAPFRVVPEYSSALHRHWQSPPLPGPCPLGGHIAGPSARLTASCPAGLHPFHKRKRNRNR